ncbi:MAG: RNase adapter RapZ [Ruthenibacterium lactatiformans]
MNLLIVTGLSGAGKSLAMHALEDIGFFCIDNIPANLLAKLMEFAQQSENTLERVAVVLDIRGGKSSEDILNALGQLKAGRVNYKILFLDARNDVLERRYKETRRRHPISIASQVSTDEAILQEREILAPLYEMADYKIDTSLFSTAQLKDRVVSLFVNRSSDAMALTVTSFGFKYGQPKEADIVFDVRCLPNPFYIPELKNKTGLDKEVVEYIMQFEEAHGLLQRMEDLVGYALPLYVKEGKSQLTIAVGCTGGKHRSIAFAEMLAAFVKKLGYHPVVEHRMSSAPIHNPAQPGQGGRVVSFSQDVKKEIIAREAGGSCCAVAAAYGFACFGKYFDTRGVVLHTEQIAVAQYAKKMFARAGVAGKIYVKGSEESRVYEFAVKEPDEVRRMLALFGHTGEEPSLRINSRNFTCEHCVSAFVAAAFLCCGTITNPQREYNLEFLSVRYNLILDFEALLMGHGFAPKHTRRKGSNVLYLKASEQIEDLLTFMGASGAALEIMNLKVYKDFRNKANRITNCETANIDKTVSASGQTLEAIAYLKKRGAFETLPAPLREAAALREQNPDLSLKELAGLVRPPLSKSGLSHRMKKLEQTAESLKERTRNG